MDYRSVAVLGPFLVPLGAFAVAIAAIVSGAWRSAQARQIKGQERMAMLARGMPVSEIEKLLGSKGEEEQRSPKDPLRSLANARRAALVLISSGLGIVVFGVLLAVIVRTREVLTVAALGLVPIAIGIGFWIDYRLQQREMSRFGLELGADVVRGGGGV